MRLMQRCLCCSCLVSPLQAAILDRAHATPGVNSADPTAPHAVTLTWLLFQCPVCPCLRLGALQVPRQTHVLGCLLHQICRLLRSPAAAAHAWVRDDAWGGHGGCTHACSGAAAYAAGRLVQLKARARGRTALVTAGRTLLCHSRQRVRARLSCPRHALFWLARPRRCKVLGGAAQPVQA